MEDGERIGERARLDLRWMGLEGLFVNSRHSVKRCICSCDEMDEIIRDAVFFAQCHNVACFTDELFFMEREIFDIMSFVQCHK